MFKVASRRNNLALDISTISIVNVILTTSKQSSLVVSWRPSDRSSEELPSPHQVQLGSGAHIIN